MTHWMERDFFRFSRVAPGSAISVLLPGEWFGRLTRRYCDCGTALGAAHRAALRKEEFIERKLDRLRRKGWSGNRVERWLAQVEADAKATAERHANEARAWHGWLRHALKDVGIGHIGLLVDDYGGYRNEKPTPAVRNVRLRDVDERFLEDLKKGVL
jgi:hypothetical protein